MVIIFFYGSGLATVTIDFDNMPDCQKELHGYIEFLNKQEIDFTKAECEIIPQ